MKKTLLLTNDDGIDAPGLRHLWLALREEFAITICAPAGEQSSVALSITARTPIKYRRVDWDYQTPAWSVNGTPADCVKLARSIFLPSPPHLIVSGINRGSNAGRNALYSGTVGAVVEGLLSETPGVAFSAEDYEKPDYSSATPWILPIVEHTLLHPLSSGTLLNVNFPKMAPYKGIKLTCQGKQHFSEAPVACDRDSYWLGIRTNLFQEEQESDIRWLEKGYISAVPLHYHDLTDRKYFSQKETFESLTASSS